VKKKDPLHDGSILSYAMRFVICFILGLFIDVLILGSCRYFNMRGLFDLWYIWASLPFATGLLGVFKFDVIVKIYDEINSKYSN